MSMSVSIQLIIFVVILLLLFLILFYMFLKKDQDLAEIKGKYEHLLKIESDHFKMNKKRDDYVAMMVHELRSPLSVIRGSVDLVMKEEKALSGDQKHTMLTQIKESTTDLLAIVNDILDVSKIESGRFEIHKANGNINHVLEDQANYYTALAIEKGLKVETSFDSSLPELEFDEERIRHVMNNLLSNALKYTDAGGFIKITTHKVDESFARVEVSDNGVGIPEYLQDKLFNKFVQMENRKNATQKGTGLGLFIAKGIVDAHGGSIWVESNKPKGSKFIFTLPLVM